MVIKSTIIPPNGTDRGVGRGDRLRDSASTHDGGTLDHHFVPNVILFELKPLLDLPENQFGSQPVVRDAGIASGIALPRFLHSTVAVRTLTTMDSACRGLWALPG